ncbi:SH3 domain-containing protein, partial [Brockia lithotrophica]|uniref:SH3 domain-containing protein n=1 Tax=Brockia lithotrophica TaxID=933949 RepID=UPI001475943E
MVVPALVISSYVGGPSSTDVHAAEVPSQVKVTADYLNVRSGPGTNYRIIGGLRQGTVVPVLRADGSWYYVKLSTGTTGYIAGWYTEPVRSVSSVSVPVMTSFAANAREARLGEGIRLSFTARDDAGIYKL